MKWIISILMTGAVTAVGTMYVAQTRSTLIDHVRGQMDEMELTDAERADLTAVLDQGMLPPGFGTEVPHALMTRIGIAGLLSRFRYPLFGLTFAVCLAGAHFFVRSGR